MGIENITYTLSNINALLGSGANYAKERSEGVQTGDALFNFGLNVINGAARNEVAHEMARYGNSTGHLINGLAGYGNPEANTKGTFGLMMANMPPLFGFGYPMMGGFAPFGGAFGGSIFSGGCCNSFMPMSMGYPMMGTGMFGCGMFGNSRFYC